ncbi:MAG TPA: Na+/H+ antiporter subunit E [Methanomicrobiales archaeon]|nr:Na+/H+ antiporter subunit E [Methanomicrobiales archaeon]
MIPFAVTWVFAFLVYLTLTAGSGDLIAWSAGEIFTGAFLALLVAAVSRNFFAGSGNYRMANPLRWLLLAVYSGVPFFLEMAKANFDVAYRVITGRIRPGIVRVTSDLKTDLGIVTLADSITLTPGTLSVDIDEETNDLFIHVINIPEGDEKKPSWDARDLFSLFNIPAWIRRITE